jgi:hypothetical protein
MTRYPSARARLTLLYTSLFAAGGAVLISDTYVLLNHFLTVNPQSFGKPTIASDAIARCVAALTGKGGLASSVAKARCSSAYGAAHAQRQTTLDHLRATPADRAFRGHLLAPPPGGSFLVASCGPSTSSPPPHRRLKSETQPRTHQTTGGLTVTGRLPVRAAQPAEVPSSRQTISP